jgi:hypothetical protein
MNGHKILPVAVLLAAFSISSCSGPKAGTIIGGGGSGTVSVTLIADTLPANPSILTFQVAIASITFTPSSGTATTKTFSPPLLVDLMRLQSDTAFLGTFANLPTGQYTSVTLALNSPANITFLNDTTTTLSGCQAGFICPLSVSASSQPVANISFAVSNGTVTGIGVDVNLSNVVSISGSNLVVNFANTKVLSAVTLPRAGSTLAAGQLDLIEDFTGVVSLGSPAVTVTSATATGRGSLTATPSTSTNLDSDPSGTLCPAGTTQLSSCVGSNYAASMDVVLKNDGTLAVQEIEPLLKTLQDTVEGIVVGVTSGSSTQFTLIVTDFIPAAQSSLIGTVTIGSGLTVNLVNANNFLIDTKGLQANGLNNFAGNLSNFSGVNNTTALHLGQTVAVHVTSFTAASGTTLASCNSDTVTLRWSRFAAPVSQAGSTVFDITTLPSYFNLSGTLQVQNFTGTAGADGVTNLDGISSTSGLVANGTVYLRALYIENPGFSLQPAFYAAKVRQP